LTASPAPTDKTRPAAPALLARLAPLAVLAAILGAALFLRFYDLASNPGGLYGDEAAEGLDAWRLLNQPGFHPDFLVWFQDDGGREALFAYVVAGAFWLFGPSTLVLRGVAAAFGVAGVLAIGWLGRRFGTWVGLAAAAWAAGSLWLVCVSRDGMRNATVPLFGAVALVALLRWADRPGRGAAVVAGAVTSLAALYTYQPLKLLPVLAAIWWLWLRFANRPAYDRLRPGIPAFCATFLVVAAPMLAVAVTNPTSYFGRVAATSPFNPETHSDIVIHTLETLGMFGVTGDPNARHDVAGAPLLSMAFVLIAFVGLIRLWRLRREPASSLILWSLPIFLLPPLVATDGGAPHFLRSLGLAAPLGVAIGLGAAEFVDWARDLERPSEEGPPARPGPTPRPRFGLLAPVTIAVTAALLGAMSYSSGNAYFGRPVADRYQAYSYPLSDIAAYAAGHPGTAVILDEHSGYVVGFLDAGLDVEIYRAGSAVPDAAEHPAFLALSTDHIRSTLGDAAAERARPIAWDPAGKPSAWVTTP
jgi:4-amino-4-deoxy-L-arabinose transferase-like glycosyltransferase